MQRELRELEEQQIDDDLEYYDGSKIELAARYAGIEKYRHDYRSCTGLQKLRRK